MELQRQIPPACFAFSSSLLFARLSAGIKHHRIRVATVSAKLVLQATSPAAHHILMTLMAQSRLYCHLQSSLMCFEMPPIQSVNGKQKSIQGRVLRNTQWLLQDKEIKWLLVGPLAENARKCRALAVPVGEGGKATALFVRPISGFHPLCPSSFPHPPHFSSVTITK